MTARCICDPWAAEEECRVHNPARLPCPRCHLLWPVRDGFIVCPAHGSYDVDDLCDCDRCPECWAEHGTHMSWCLTGSTTRAESS